MLDVGKVCPEGLTLGGHRLTGVSQPVQGAITEEWVVEETRRFLHGPVGCDEAGDPMPTDAVQPNDGQ